jgi:HK97 family phage major capsid protein
MAENTRYPEIVEALAKEIKALGDNTKQNYESLQKNYENLKSVADHYGDNMASDVKEQVNKLSEDITIRQEALDIKIAAEQKETNDKLNGRLDQIEVAMQRPTNSMSFEAQEKLEKECQAFAISAVVGSKKEGVSYKDLEGIKMDVEVYKEYQKNFNTFLRQKGDERNLTPDQFKSLSVGVNPDGGYTVTPQMSNRIITKMFESDPIRQLAATETITTHAIEWLVDWDEMGSGWEAETETGAETSTPQFYRKHIPVHVAYAKPRATQTLIEDSGINIENWIADKAARRLYRTTAASFVTGTGVGQPRGFTTYSSGTTYKTVEQVAMGSGTGLTADGFIKVKYSLIEEYLNRGTWLMNRLAVADTMYLKDGTGAYIWKPGLQGDANATLCGLPVRMSTTMPVVAADSLSVALADWSEAYMVVNRLGISVQRDPYTVKPYVEYYTRMRVGGDVINPQALKIGKVSA